MNEDIQICDYAGCEEIGSILLDLRGGVACVCEKHAEQMHDKTGYCGINCQLGYGCTQEC